MPRSHEPSLRAKGAGILRVAVPSPLRRSFDYLIPEREALPPARGARVLVPFGRSRRVGVVLGESDEARVERGKLRPILQVIDREPLLPARSMALLEWASAYYQHPIGEVMTQALPVTLRRGRPAGVPGSLRWYLTESGRRVSPEHLVRAPAQAKTLARLAAHPEGLAAADPALAGCARTLRVLQGKGWVGSRHDPCLPPLANAPEEAPVLVADQRRAVDSIVDALGSYHSFLLEGVTGSGKTEVYLQVIERTLGEGYQALVLLPEIGLTPQTVERFRRRLHVPIAVLHSSLSDQDRLCAWMMVRDGLAPILVGTRSAVLAPMARPGVIIVDEEHDLSFKQQDGFRYSARDLAVVRARMEGVPVVLGSATPSLETVHNAEQGRYARLDLAHRVGGSLQPHFRVVDVRGRAMEGGLSPRLLDAIGQRLARGQQSLLFINRRGYAPSVLCHACGWVASCERCDAHLTLHRRTGRLRCHHCGAQRPAPERCPHCAGGELIAIGSGTERVEAVLGERFPHARVARMDRDSTRRRGSLQSLLERIGDAEVDILIGTQMLAKGHHFPRVTLVGILDADAGLFSTDFRAGERLAQLVTQVAGRAGRGADPGEVLLQTHHPEHPMLHALITSGYGRFARETLTERAQAVLPPFCALALLRAESTASGEALGFLAEARDLALSQGCPELEVLGPAPAAMERRAGRYRAQLLVQSPSRRPLRRLLEGWLPRVGELVSARRVRWSIDVDPQEMS